MCVEQLALKVAFPELCFRKLHERQYLWTYTRNKRDDLVRYIVTIRFRYDWEFLEYIVYELRCDDDLDFSALYRLWAGIDELTWTTAFLALCRCLCKQEVLRVSSYVNTHSPRRDATRGRNKANKNSPLSLPKIPPR